MVSTIFEEICEEGNSPRDMVVVPVREKVASDMKKDSVRGAKTRVMR